VVCPDNQRMGGSALGDRPLTVDAKATDLEALLDEPEPEPELDQVGLAAWLASERDAPDPATAPPALVVHGVEDAVIPVANGSRPPA